MSIYTRAGYTLTQIAIVLVSLCIMGCSVFGLVDNVDLPQDVLDPGDVKTERGALALYSGVIRTFGEVYGGSSSGLNQQDAGTNLSFVRMTGHLTDELDYRASAAVSGNNYLNLSLRNYDDLEERAVWFFSRVSTVRTMSVQAVVALRTYGSRLPDSLIAHSLAIESATIIMLAEAYCSGVPVSILTQTGDFSLSEGLTTQELYSLAINKLDSALTYDVQNERISSFINVLKVRALLGIGDIDNIPLTADRVDNSFKYSVSYPKTQNGSLYYSKFTIASSPNIAEVKGDVKGVNGLPYASNEDPRASLPELANPWAPLVIASGVEALLAKAEVAFNKKDPSWLTILNSIRTSCTDPSACTDPAPPGIGGVAGLPMLDDPATGLNWDDPIARKSRLDLLFTERAYWLFLTGHRQGDLRRRLRTYGESVYDIYPTGLAVVGGIGYGDIVNLPVPDAEIRLNNKYRGCFHRDP